MKTARYQNGDVVLSTNGSGERVWLFRWYETQVDGKRIRRKKKIGNLDQYKDKRAAEKAAASFRLAINSGKRNELSNTITMSQLITHFRERELVDLGEDGRAYSTRNSYECTLDAWIKPRWGKTRIDEIKAPMVEELVAGSPLQTSASQEADREDKTHRSEAACAGNESKNPESAERPL